MIDIVFFVLVGFGFEGTLISNGDPIFNIPWSHSLFSSLLLSGLAGLGFKLWKKLSGWRAFWVVSGLVFSHWILDFIVHRPDLPLFPGADEVYGLGVWNFPWLAYFLEVGLLFFGFVYWVSHTKPLQLQYRIAPWVLFVLMGGIQFMIVTMPGLQVQNGTFDPTSQPQGVFLSVSGLMTFFALAGTIGWIEAGRVLKTD